MNASAGTPMRAALDRANRSLYAGRPAEAEALMDELLFPRRSAIAVWLRRAWHRLTCRQPHCFLLFGEFQHPRANRFQHLRANRRA